MDNLSMDAARLGSSAKNRHDKTMTVPPLILHDNRNTQDALHLLPVSKRKQTDSRFRRNQTSVINNDKNKNFHVCSIRQKLSPSRSDVPSLTSISYRTTDSEPDNKSLVYTLSVPYNGESSRPLSDLRSRSGHEGRRKLPKRKFVSTMNINVTTKISQDGTNKHSVFSSEGHTKFHELNDLEPLDAYSYDTDFGRTNDSHSRIQNLSGLNTYPRQSAKNRHDDDIDLLPSNRTRSNFALNGVTLKQRLNYERKSKEVLASAKRQMVDWLLSNQRLNTESQHSEPLGQYAHPLSMSTPSLKMKQTHNKHLLSNRNSLERHSFDSRELRSDVPQSVLIERDKYERKSFDSEDLLNDAELRDADSRASAMSSRDSENKNPQGQIHEDFRCDSSITSGDEYGGVQNRGSLIESSLGMAEEHLEYLKLARLVNRHSNLTLNLTMSDLSESYQDVIGATAKPTRTQTEDRDTKPDVLSAEKGVLCIPQFTLTNAYSRHIRYLEGWDTLDAIVEAINEQEAHEEPLPFETNHKSQKSDANINDTQSDEKVETLCEDINRIFGEFEKVMIQFFGNSLDLIESAKAETLSCVRNTLRNEHWAEKNDLRQQLNDIVNPESGLQTQPLQSDAENRKPKVMEATIENNLKRYKQYISECVKVTDLIAFYDLFTVTQTNRFRSMYRNCPVEATEMAFDEIFAMRNQPDKYKCLLSALKDAGYSKVVQILQGVLKPVGSIHKKLLRSCSKDLFHQLSIKDVLPHLYEKEIISLDDMQQIMQTERTEGNGSAVLHLLSLLPNRHEYWFKHFVESLNESSQTHLAEALVSNDMQIKEQLNQYKPSNSIVPPERPTSCERVINTRCVCG